MANARMAALLARRAPTLGSGSIRVLTPQNTGISSIAKRNAANESEAMINKYNNGLISNAEMKTFLQSQVSSPYVSDSDKTDIQAKLQDFDVLIEKDRLESVFKLAQENTLQKEQAAKALAQFYTQRASTMIAGTPAHSQALENAGNWQATVTNIQQSVSKQQRKNLENSLLQKINALPTSSSERSAAQAEMYKQLYDMANSQGDTDDAQVYAAKYEQAKTYAEQYGEQETQKESLKSIKLEAAQLDNDIAKLENKSLEEAKAMVDKANTIAQRYADMGDQYNATRYSTMAIQATEKYNKVLASANTAEKNKLYAQEDSNYSDRIRLIQEMYTVGKRADGSPFTEQNYKDEMRDAVSERKMQIQSQLEDAGSSDKIYWKGSNKKSATVIDDIQKELDNIEGMDNAIEQGALALFEIPPTNKMGKNIARFELKDTRFLNNEEKALVQYDQSGIGHIGQMGETEISKDIYEEAGGSALDPTMRFDRATGKYYQQTGLQYDMVDPESGAVIKQKQGEYGDRLATAQQIIEGEKQKLGVKPGEKYEVNPEKAFKINQDQTTMSAQEIARNIERKNIKTKQEITNKDIVSKEYKNKSNLFDSIMTAISPAYAESKGKGTKIMEVPLPNMGQIASNLGKKISNATLDVPTGIGPTDKNGIAPVTTTNIPIGKSPFQAISTNQTAQNINKNVIQPTVQTIKNTVSTSTGQYKPSETIVKTVQPIAQAVKNTVSTPSGQYAPSVAIGNAVSSGLKTVQKAVQPTVAKIGTAISSGANWLKSKFGF